MTDDDAQVLREVILDLLRMNQDLRASHEALLQTVIESYSATEGLALLKKHEERKAILAEKFLLRLEDKLPSFAAALDASPPIPPSGDEKK